MTSFLVLRGQKKTLLLALLKLNEIAVVAVALYVLLSFQGIPYECPVDQYQTCYVDLYEATRATGGETGNFFSLG